MERTERKMEPGCADCRLHRTLNSPAGIQLICCAHPPELGITAVTAQGRTGFVSQSLWKPVAPTDWCGEFESRLDS